MASRTLTESLRETLALFDESGAPRTTTEIADRLDIGRRSTYERLERLVDQGRLETKKVGANARVYWRPRANADAATPELSAAVESLVDDVLTEADVAVFVLNEADEVAWINDAAERYFDLDRATVLGRDRRALIEESIAATVEDPETFVDSLQPTSDDGADAEGFRCRVTGGEDREARELEYHSKPVESGTYAGGRIELYDDVTERERSKGTGHEDRKEFESLVDAVEEYAIFTLDVEGHVRTWNPGAERIKGYTEDDIVGEHFSIFYTDDDCTADVPERNLSRAASRGSVEDEGWRVRADGSQFWANVTITAIRDENGDLQGFAKVTRNMTDRREREQRLRRERDLTEQVVETAPMTLGVLEPDGTFARANRRMERATGGNETITVGDVTIYDEAGDPVQPDERPYAQVFETGEPLYGWECQVEHPDGTRRWVSVNAVPFDRDGDGFEQVIVAAEDVTRLKEQARQLERQRDDLESELDEMFERIDDAFYALDDEFRFTYVNDVAEELLGNSATDLLGRNIWEALSVPDDDPIRERFERAMATQESTRFERYSEALDLWTDLRAYPSESGLSVYFSDVTDRKEREQELTRYRTIVETMSDGVYTVDPDGRFTMVNERYAEFVGEDRDELVGTPTANVVGDEAATEAQWLERELLEGSMERAKLDAEIETPDGTRWAEAKFAIMLLDDGTYERVGVVRDVTERNDRERELEESRRRYQTLVEQFPNGAAALVDEDLRYVTVGGEPLEEVDATIDDLEGTPLREALPSEMADSLVPRYERALDGESNAFESEFGDRIYQFHVVPVRDDEGDVFAAMGMSQDVTEQKERERAVHEAKTQLEAATEAGSVGTWEWDVAEDRFVAGDWLGRAVGLDPDAASEGVSIDEMLSAVHEDDRDRVEREIEAAVSSCGEYEEEYRIWSADDDLRWVVARGHVECDEDGDPVTFPGALTDITDRKRAEQALDRQRERLAALNDLNDLVHEITDAVIDQSTREEIERVVCEDLAASDSYAFAWIGDVDVPTETVELRTEAGDDGYLDGISISVDPDDERSEGPTGRAIRTGEIQTTRDVDADPGHEPWRQRSQDSDVRSSAAIPITHEGTVYGVLNVYAERVDAFTGEEREVIGQLGEVVGHAIAAAERKRALMSDEVVELQFRLRDLFEALEIDASTSGTITIDQTVPVKDDEYLAYGTATAEAVESLEALVESLPHWTDVTVRTSGDRRDFEARLSRPPILSQVASLGGSVERAVIEDGDYRMTIHLAPGSDVRQLIETIQEAYPAAEMVKRHQATRPGDRGDGGHDVLGEDLTDRQRTALEAAYHSGFFEWPREASGEDLAESLDVAPPTFHQHLRKAQQKVLDSLLTTQAPA